MPLAALRRNCLAPAALAVGAFLAPFLASTPASAEDLEGRLARIEAIKAIERLQSAYGYYQNRFLFEEPPTLFTDYDPKVVYDESVWQGKSGIERLWGRHFPTAFGTDGKGPRAGVMFDQPIFQSVIDISPDLKSARGRFQTIGRFGIYGAEEQWIGGVYENEYVREDGVWKIKALRYCSTWSAPYNRGWIVSTKPTGLPWMSFARGAKPDGFEKGSCPDAYPSGGLVPFHFLHPVTGKQIAIPAAAKAGEAE